MSYNEHAIYPLDRYLRREDTALASLLRLVSGGVQGPDYRHGPGKRIMEVAISSPAAILAAPWIIGLGALATLEDGKAPFFLQERVGKGGKPITIVKIRTMEVPADTTIIPQTAITSRTEPEDDPRNTRLGKLIRAYELDELPQLIQVVMGQLSLIGFRCLPQYVFDYLKIERPNDFDKWETAYLEAPPSLFSLFSAVEKHRKDNRRRHHYDILYAKKASLGLDLYILTRTGARLLAKIWK